MRKIVIINNKKNPSGDISITACFRLNVPTNMIKPLASDVVSVLADATFTENQDVQTGVVVEIFQEAQIAPGANLVSRAQTVLQNIHADLTTQLTNQNVANKFIGASWDGTIWS